MKDQLHNANIVLMEDDEYLSSVITSKLKSHGAVVHAYQNGLEGLAAIREYTPDLILLDIVMPVMDGYQVLEVLKLEKIIDTIPVIVISNSGHSVEIDRILEFGVDNYMVKVDFSPEEVVERVESVLAEKNQFVEPEEDTAKSHESTGLQGEDPKSLKVLVIEDDPMLRNLVGAKLRKDKCTPFIALDGKQGLTLAESFSPDVILLDLMMPDMDGFEVLEKLKQHESLKDIPVIVFSNKSEKIDQERAIKLGAHAFRIKAMTDLNDLLAELHTLGNK